MQIVYLDSRLKLLVPIHKFILVSLSSGTIIENEQQLFNPHHLILILCLTIQNVRQKL
jgi:hypothetical protein